MSAMVISYTALQYEVYGLLARQSDNQDMKRRTTNLAKRRIKFMRGIMGERLFVPVVEGGILGRRRCKPVDIFRLEADLEVCNLLLSGYLWTGRIPMVEDKCFLSVACTILGDSATS